MLTAVLSGFVLAAAAPWLHRRVRFGLCSGLLALLPAGLCLYFAAHPATTRLEAYEWVPSLGIRLSFALDGLARLFAVLITGIGALVLVYAGAYLRPDRLGRFTAFLLSFMASMLGVVLSDNLLALFVFWELTSISSFLLIGFDQHRAEARAAALQSLLVTSGGGLALLLGLLQLGQAGGTFELSALASQGDAVRAHALYTPLLLLVLAGAFTKSAQAPFHFWVPAAMVAPTPVSAYLHSSTMVKAGIYLLARLSPILGGTALWQMALGGVGAVTMVMGALLAFAQTDLKRLLAYATVSALGVMTMLLGVGGEGAVGAAMVFLVAHALYKGALFLVAGALTHATGERDVTKLGGLGRAMPVTAGIGVLAALSMVGAPPFAGFLGKELVIGAAWNTSALPILLTTAVGAAGALIVAVALVAGLRPFTGVRGTGTGADEGPAALLIAPAVLAGLGLVAGVAPGVVLEPLVGGAVASTVGSPATLPLRLWHGWSAELGIGLLSAAAGVTVYGCLAPLRARLGPPARHRAGPAECYARGLDALNRLARAQTRLLQSGHLSRYLLLTTGTTVALVGTTLLRRPTPISVAWSDIRVYELGIAASVIVAAVGAACVRSRLGAVAALGAVGFGVALFFAMLGAPDLAMTQFVVEALLVILFVLVFYDVPPSTVRSSRLVRARDATVAAAIGALMTALVLVATTVQVEPTISGYYVERSVPQAHGHNVVNVILVDFRAIDTLGEISVLAIAGLGVYALTRLRPGGVRP